MGMGESRGKKFYVPCLGLSRPVVAVTRLAMVICDRGVQSSVRRGSLALVEGLI